MIRAVYRRGSIELIDLVPPTWTDGTELLVESNTHESAELGRWRDDMEAHAAEVLPEDIEELNAALAQADQEAKARTRRELELEP